MHARGYTKFEVLYVSSKDSFHEATSTLSTKATSKTVLQATSKAVLQATSLDTNPPSMQFARTWVHSWFFNFLSQFELWHKIALRLHCKR